MRKRFLLIATLLLNILFADQIDKLTDTQQSELKTKVENYCKKHNVMLDKFELIDGPEVGYNIVLKNEGGKSSKDLREIEEEVYDLTKNNRVQYSDNLIK